MAIETGKKSLSPCVSVGGYRTESVPTLSRTCMDESGRLIVVVEIEDVKKAGDAFPLVGLAGVNLAQEIPSLEMPEIFTRAKEMTESITDSFLSSPEQLGRMMSYKPSLIGSRHHMVTGDGGVRLREVVIEIFGKSKDLVSEDFALKSSSPHLELGEDIGESLVREPHQEALEWIKSATGLSWEDIGDDLLNVSRPTIHAWRRGESITRNHRQHLFAVREVLERATRHHTRPSDLAAWLDMPRGTEGKTPAQLLKAGEIARARLLAITTLSPKVEAPAKWTNQHEPDAYHSSRERAETLRPDRDEELLEMLDEDGEE